MIPENSSFERALELYIKKKVFTVLFDLGKISQVVYNNTQQEYAWAVGDCQNEEVLGLDLLVENKPIEQEYYRKEDGKFDRVEEHALMCCCVGV